ncbi:MAG TPA: type II toxin-antitoxin system PemK/MazF family toxin [Chitinophagales bacterium]|nr:type II toxin-antitoxin system PemK/MazF family toxin [Chitinophagales bacterium]
MEVGTIVKAAFLQADRQIKIRPAVIIKLIPPYNDFLICAISTQTHLFVEGLDIRIEKHSADFTSSGLLQESIIRVGMLASVPKNMLQGAIGKTSQPMCEQILRQLRNFI